MVTAINANQGIKIEGDGEAAFETAGTKILALCKPVATVGHRSSSPRLALVAKLEAEVRQLQSRQSLAEAEKDRTEAEKQLLQAEKDRAEAEKQHLQSVNDRVVAEKQQLQAEKDRAEADLVAMKQQMEAEIASLRARLGGAGEDS